MTSKLKTAFSGERVAQLLGLAILVAVAQTSHAQAVSLTLSPIGALTFGDVPLGTTSSPITLTATANLDPGSTVTQWSVLGVLGFPPFQFEQETGTCASSISVCILDITFRPNGLGDAFGQLALFADTSSGLASSGPVFLSGTSSGVPVSVPGPVVGAGLPALLFGSRILCWCRRRQKIA